MSKSKTIAQRMEEARIQAGAQNYKGHDYMDLARFDENTRHMIIFHVLTHDSPVGDKGDKMRLYLSDKGYQKALENLAAAGCSPVPVQQVRHHQASQLQIYIRL